MDTKIIIISPSTMYSAISTSGEQKTRQCVGRVCLHVRETESLKLVMMVMNMNTKNTQLCGWAGERDIRIIVRIAHTRKSRKEDGEKPGGHAKTVLVSPQKRAQIVGPHEHAHAHTCA